MYKAHFVCNKKEPEKMYFEASQIEPEEIEFTVPERKVVKLIINKDKTLEVE